MCKRPSGKIKNVKVGKCLNPCSSGCVSGVVLGLILMHKRGLNPCSSGCVSGMQLKKAALEMIDES